jgi:glycosyltransferase involved in cell wall biosynthesis
VIDTPRGIGHLSRVGTVVIGRNEARHLERALRSILSPRGAVVYVDSGSIDGSLQLAQSIGVVLRALDPVKPFSAARARHEGAEALLDRYDGIELLQFLDGDCALADGWLERAQAFLDENAV